MSLRLRCTVRGCVLPLALRGTALACDAGHSFDRAREGYWNLLQPQDRRSDRPGDRLEALVARRRWLGEGFASGLIAALREVVGALDVDPGRAAIDVGCGEGTITQGIGRPFCGIDLSTSAIRMAARLNPQGTWIVANADRGLPFEDGSVALALSVFGRRPVAELARVLPPGAALVVVVPGPDDLLELREAVKGLGVRRDRAVEVAAELAGIAEPDATRRWEHRARHDRRALEDALAMSYRGERLPERRRLEGLDGLDVTLSASILAMRRT